MSVGPPPPDRTENEERASRLLRGRDLAFRSGEGGSDAGDGAEEALLCLAWDRSGGPGLDRGLLARARPNRWQPGRPPPTECVNVDELRWRKWRPWGRGWNVRVHAGEGERRSSIRPYGLRVHNGRVSQSYLRTAGVPRRDEPGRGARVSAHSEGRTAGECTAVPEHGLRGGRGGEGGGQEEEEAGTGGESVWA